jgi:hypothetical protein
MMGGLIVQQRASKADKDEPSTRRYRVPALGFIGLAAVALINTALAASRPASLPAFPLEPSADNRYLVDQNNVPFLMAGDSPQSLIGNLSEEKAAEFLANRATYGVNALWINLLCDSYTACNSDGTTFDGIAPFTTPGDLSTPNPAYFDRAADMINLAAAQGMVVLLDPIETGGWLSILQANGTAKARAYGKYLGKRFKNYPNIIWMSGNDFQSWQNPSDDALVSAVARGIQSTDSNHIHTIELSYYVSASLDDKTWRPIVGLDAAYTYRPTYAKVLSEYQRSNFKPVFMVEANYEFEQNGGTDGGSTPNLRHQEYWTMLSGATGQLYGSSYTWRFPGDWEENLDTPGIIQFSYMKQLFEARKWYDLVPDRPHEVVTAGRGHFSKDDSITTDTYATAARTSDGTLAMAYLPSTRRVTVDMSKLSGPVTARWFDPTNAHYTTISGSPFPNSGSRHFTPPGNNSDGDGDWVLVLEAD